MNAVDKEVGDNLLSASRLLGNAGVTVAILLDESCTVTQKAGDEGGVKEGSSGISLVSDDDDWILQGVVPWTGEPFDSTSGPPVAKVASLRELNADWTRPVRRMLEEVIINGHSHIGETSLTTRISSVKTAWEVMLL